MHTLPETRIHKSAIKAWKISAVFYGIPLYVLPALLFALYKVEPAVDFWYPVIAAPLTIVVHLFLIIVLPKIRWKRWRYSVSEQGVDMFRGIIVHKRTMVPINRVQHVDTKQGPIYRKYGLSSISLSTAATTHEIPALDDETANHLRSLISELVRQAKDDV